MTEVEFQFLVSGRYREFVLLDDKKKLPGYLRYGYVFQARHLHTGCIAVGRDFNGLIQTIDSLYNGNDPHVNLCQ